MKRGALTFDDGWPSSREFLESPHGAHLVAAVRDAPGGERLNDDDVRQMAIRLRTVAIAGRYRERPAQRPASSKASEDELRKLHALAGRLSDHIGTMRAPAVRAFWDHGHDVLALAETLEAVRDDARRALDDLKSGDGPSGRPQKIQAGEVAREAARLFRRITGTRPTFTSDPDTGEVRGAWPAFLSDVFAALGIEASVAAQVRTVSEKTASQSGDKLS